MAYNNVGQYARNPPPSGHCEGEESGWHVFSSARFHDSPDGVYEGFHLGADGKIYEQTPDGDVRPWDISVTKNVVQLWIVVLLMLVIFWDVRGGTAVGKPATTPRKVL